MIDFEALYAQHNASWEDFWDRRAHAPHFRRKGRFWGRLIAFSSNHAGVLDAVDHALPLYSTAPDDGQPLFSIQLVVRDNPVLLGPLPDNLFDTMQYSGEADWLMIKLGEFGSCHVDLNAGRAVAVLAPELAVHPQLVSLYLLNTIITNFFIAKGYAMLHASCLLHGQRALMLMAPHNTGKSTTALRLILSGYQLVSDSMIFLSPVGEEPMLLGWPVGRIKLRGDMLDHFPELRPLLSTEQVRGETKYVVDIRRIDPTLSYSNGICPTEIDLCLLSRSEDGDTYLRPTTYDVVLDAVIVNSIFYDTPQVWKRNLSLIHRLLRRAQFYQLAIGVETDGIVEKLEHLRQ